VVLIIAMKSRRPSRQPSARLRQFAAAHRLKVQTSTEEDIDTDLKIVSHEICFGDRATISDLAHTNDVNVMLGLPACSRGLLKTYAAERRLSLTIWREHRNYLFQTIAFDVPAYANPKEPTSTLWAETLARLGIQYLGGDDNGICFTFPTDNPEAVQTVFALSSKKVMLRGLGLRA
jgi:hypothetical protein